MKRCKFQAAEATVTAPGHYFVAISHRRKLLFHSRPLLDLFFQVLLHSRLGLDLVCCLSRARGWQLSVELAHTAQQQQQKLATC